MRCARPETAVPTRIFDRASIGAGGLYIALSIIFLGRRLISDFAGSYVGRYADPTLFIWSIAWWPYALSHRLNPIVTHAIYAPVGTNLAWLTTVPLASVLVWPITAACGPIVSYNLLALLAPASAAWAAYILCRYLSKSVWPAILGGYVFGFSPYFLAQTLAGHLHMVLILPVPIVLYLVARWFDGALESRKMACLAGLAIAAQLLLSLEVFATATMFAGLALLLGFGSATVDTRQRIVNLVGILACAYGLALLIASPFIYYLGGPGHLGGTMRAAEQFSADMLNLLVPTQVNALGALGPLPSLTRIFPGNVFERDAYIGPVLIVLAIVYARRYWREPFGKVVIDSLLIICVLSLGPMLQIGGHRWIALPGYVLAKTPLINNAVAARFMMFAFLIFCDYHGAMVRDEQYEFARQVVRRDAGHIVFIAEPRRPLLAYQVRHSGVFYQWSLQEVSGARRKRTRHPLRALWQQHALAGSKRILLPHGGRMDRSIAGGI